MFDDAVAPRDAEEFPDFEELLSAMPATLTTAYSSPLMRRLSKGSLTLPFLAEHVPAFQAGQKAETRLADKKRPPTPQQRESLLREVAAGEVAKDRLVQAAIPLIRMLANKEFQQRGGYQGRSRTSTDELFQEGIIGLFAGLMKYNPKGAQSSATNYLGAWIRVNMQRGTDSREHDFHVGYGVSQRHKRIQATRARLQAELGHKPSYDQIIAAWTDRTYQPGRMMGRLNQGETKNIVTYAQLEEEEQNSSRLGVKSMPVDHEGNTRGYEEASPLEPDSFVDEQGDNDTKRFLAELLDSTMKWLEVGDVQRQIINLKFGLDGFDEHPVAAIISATRLSRPKVSAVIDCFTTEMLRKHGAFHKVCSQVDEDDLIACGFGWVLTNLGPYEYTQIVPPAVLSSPMAPADGKPPPPPLRSNEKPGQIRAQFMCPTHQEGFVGSYKDAGDVPGQRACPRCDRPSPVIRVLET